MELQDAIQEKFGLVHLALDPFGNINDLPERNRTIRTILQSTNLQSKNAFKDFDELEASLFCYPIKSFHQTRTMQELEKRAAPRI